MKKDIRDLYDICSTDYDKHMELTGHYLAQNKIYSKVLPHIEEPIIDLASGSGYLLSLLCKDFSSVVGNDFSKEMIDLVKKRKLSVPLTNKDVESIDLEGVRFNTVICCNLFYYISDYKKALKNWDKLLTERGKIILIEESPFIKPESNEMDKYSQELMDLVKPIPIETIIKVMGDNNFELVKKYKTSIDKSHSLFGLVFNKNNKI